MIATKAWLQAKHALALGLKNPSSGPPARADNKYIFFSYSSPPTIPRYFFASSLKAKAMGKFEKMLNAGVVNEKEVVNEPHMNAFLFSCCGSKFAVVSANNK